MNISMIGKDFSMSTLMRNRTRESDESPLLLADTLEMFDEERESSMKAKIIGTAAGILAAPLAVFSAPLAFGAGVARGIRSENTQAYRMQFAVSGTAGAFAVIAAIAKSMPGGGAVLPIGLMLAYPEIVRRLPDEALKGIGDTVNSVVDKVTSGDSKKSIPRKVLDAVIGGAAGAAVGLPAGAYHMYHAVKERVAKKIDGGS